MAELGPDGPGYHREVGGARARARDRAPIVGVGELARDYAPDEWAADPEAAVELVAGLLGAGDAVLVKGSRSVGLEAFTDGLRGPGRRRLSLLAAQVEIGEIASSAIDRGEVLIAGMAAMLITIFLGPKFIDFLRVREFGQQIREEGPQEHHAKAGTPTMGGLILFLAIAVPYLVLSDRDTAEPRGLRGRDRLRGARLRRRLHQDLQAPLARALGAATSCSARSRSRWRSGGSPTTRSGSTRRSSRGSSTPRSTSARCSTSSSSSW